MSARIEKLVGMATLQGDPLHGYLRYGVPHGGAFDRESFALGAALLGAPPSLAIELSNAAIDMVFGAAARVAVTGATNLRQQNQSAFDLPAGGCLSLAAPTAGLRTYVSVAGGWIPDGVDSVLGRSGRQLRPGDVLEHRETSTAVPPLRLAEAPTSLGGGPIRVVRGPEPLTVLGGSYTVSIKSDRAGIRLDGHEPIDFGELVSEPACPGAIQLTPGGELIVIGPDGPTIGGYPKVAVVCSADLDRLAQLRPGNSVTFVEVDLDTARRLRRDRDERIRKSGAEIGAYLIP